MASKEYTTPDAPALFSRELSPVQEKRQQQALQTVVQRVDAADLLKLVKLSSGAKIRIVEGESPQVIIDFTNPMHAMSLVAAIKDAKE